MDSNEAQVIIFLKYFRSFKEHSKLVGLSLWYYFDVSPFYYSNDLIAYKYQAICVYALDVKIEQ